MSNGVDVVAEVQCQDWQHFRETVYANDNGNNGPVYRGVADSGWRLLTSLDRLFGHLNETERSAVAVKAAELFRGEAERYGVDIPSDAREALSVGQHLGLPTRLLDWTLSPYVAAFFAFSSYCMRKRTDRQPDDEVAVWALQIDQEMCLNGSDVAHSPIEMVRARPHINSRLYAQMGMFTVNNTGKPFLETLKDWGKTHLLKQLIIPASEAEVALRDLRLMRIDDATMFPDLSGAVRGIISSFLIESTHK